MAMYDENDPRKEKKIPLIQNHRVTGVGSTMRYHLALTTGAQPQVLGESDIK